MHNETQKFQVILENDKLLKFIQHDIKDYGKNVLNNLNDLPFGKIQFEENKFSNYFQIERQTKSQTILQKVFFFNKFEGVPIIFSFCHDQFGIDTKNNYSKNIGMNIENALEACLPCILGNGFVDKSFEHILNKESMKSLFKFCIIPNKDVMKLENSYLSPEFKGQFVSSAFDNVILKKPFHRGEMNSYQSEFENAFRENVKGLSFWSILIVSKGSEKTLNQIKERLKENKPVIILKNSGFVSDQFSKVQEKAPSELDEKGKNLKEMFENENLRFVDCETSDSLKNEIFKLWFRNDFIKKKIHINKIFTIERLMGFEDFNSLFTNKKSFVIFNDSNNSQVNFSLRQMLLRSFLNFLHDENSFFLTNCNFLKDILHRIINQNKKTRDKFNFCHSSLKSSFKTYKIYDKCFNLLFEDSKEILSFKSEVAKMSQKDKKCVYCIIGGNENTLFEMTDMLDNNISVIVVESSGGIAKNIANFFHQIDKPINGIKKWKDEFSTTFDKSMRTELNRHLEKIRNKKHLIKIVPDNHEQEDWLKTYLFNALFEYRKGNSEEFFKNAIELEILSVPVKSNETNFINFPIDNLKNKQRYFTKLIEANEKNLLEIFSYFYPEWTKEVDCLKLFYPIKNINDILNFWEEEKIDLIKRKVKKSYESKNNEKKNEMKSESVFAQFAKSNFDFLKLILKLERVQTEASEDEKFKEETILAENFVNNFYSLSKQQNILPKVEQNFKKLKIENSTVASFNKKNILDNFISTSKINKKLKDILLRIRKAEVDIFSQNRTTPQELKNLGDRLFPSMSKFNVFEKYVSNKKLIFIWSVLSKKTDVAEFIWLQKNQNISLALLAKGYLECLMNNAKIQNRMSLYKTLKEYASEWEDKAVKTMEDIYKNDEKFLLHYLGIKRKEWSFSTIMFLARQSKARKFISSDCYQTKLNEIWFGITFPFNMKILLHACLSFVFNFVSFFFFIRKIYIECKSCYRTLKSSTEEESSEQQQNFDEKISEESSKGYWRTLLSSPVYKYTIHFVSYQIKN